MPQRFKDITGTDLIGSICKVDGTIIIDDGEGDVVSLNSTNQTVIITGCRMHYTDSAWRFVIDIEYTDRNNQDNNGFIVPANPYCNSIQMTHLESPESQHDKNLMRQLEIIAKNCHKITRSPKFKHADIATQHETLDKSIDELDALVARAFLNSAEDNVACLAKGYLCFPAEFQGKINPESIPYVQISPSNNLEPIEIEGDVIACGYPEINYERNTPYDTKIDFPISNGEPMIMIENTQKSLAYFIRLRDVLSLSPIHEHDTLLD